MFRTSASSRPVKLIGRGTVKAHALTAYELWAGAQRPSASQVAQGATPYDRGLIEHEAVDVGEVSNLRGDLTAAAKRAFRRWYRTPHG